MTRIRKHGVSFSGDGGVESVDDTVVGEEMSEGLDELVDGVAKVGPVDMEVDEKGRDEVSEGQFGGISDVKDEIEGGMVSESKDGSKGGDSSVVSDEGRGNDEILRECADAEDVGVGEGSHSVSFEAKEDVKVEGKDDKEGEVAKVDEEESKEHGQIEEMSIDGPGSNVESEATGSAVEVKTAGIDESMRDGELDASSGSQMVMGGGDENQTLEDNIGLKTGEDVLMPEDVPPGEVSVNAENEDNSVDVAIELESYAATDGNVSDDSDVSDDSNDSGPLEPEFQPFDLVWGKVRSHPWWPGQICDPSDASKQAKKYFKKHSYLITYFWDCTFAWNEAPQIKPFWENFPKMERQSNMEEFQNAVAYALDEVSRRVEFGLACFCISKEVYAKLKTQTILNAGIKEEASKRDGGDSSLSAASFEPLKLIKFAKQAAKLPFARVDRLEFVTSRAQLSSFNRWKGYSQLPEFNFLGGLLEHDADISLLTEKRQSNELWKDALPVIKGEELEKKSKGKESSLHKRKHVSGGSSQPSKKGKNSSKVTAEKDLSTPMSEKGSERQAVCKSVSQSSSKKRKAVDGAISDDSAVKHSKSASSALDDVSLQNKQTFKVGDKICRVATLLSGSSPIFKHYNAAPADAEVQDEGKEKFTSQKPETEKLIDMVDPSADEMLSQLCLAAINPNEEHSMLISLIASLAEFRNTICLEPLSPDEKAICVEPLSPDENTLCMELPSPDEDQLPLRQIFGGMRGKKSTKTGKKSTKPPISKSSPADKIVKSQNENGESLLGAESYVTTCVVESQSSLDLESLKPALDNENEELVHGSATGYKDSSAVERQASVKLNPSLDSKQNIACGDLDLSGMNSAMGNENGSLACELSSVVELPADPELNPNLGSGLENAGGDTSSEALKPALDSESRELVAGALSNKDSSAVESQASLEFNPNMDSARKLADGDHDSEAVKPALPSETSEEDSPAALILNFSESVSLPSAAYLNRIFSCFGPLNESQTELMKKTNRAKVVFKRRSDAQKAFSSAGKYGTFGPSLESYRLKYPLSPSKAAPSPKKVAKQGKRDASGEGGAAREH